ncbi:hypothetical protein DENSPDRAFT_131326 [Dentipellis sp. KUC8613]|nr:hypothetical protein DENSPDRAFT_131326 [Dentipellis sp. KUC8613]
MFSRIIAGAMPIYRCSITWERSPSSQRIVYSLVVVLLATIACVVASLYYESQTYVIGHATNATMPLPQEWSRRAHMFALFRTASDVMVLLTPMAAAMCIVVRIWWASRNFGEHLGKRTGSAYQSAIKIILESGAIYLSALVAVLVVHQTAFTYAPTFDYILNPLLGIARALIDIRVGTGRIESTLRFTMTAQRATVRTTRPMGSTSGPETGYSAQETQVVLPSDSVPSGDINDQRGDVERQSLEISKERLWCARQTASCNVTEV